MEKYSTLVDFILYALKAGTKTEQEGIEACCLLAQCQLLDWEYLRYKDGPLYDKVWEFCERHPLAL